MATLVLSAVGAGIGAGFGGTVLGLSGMVIGRAVGATLGRAIDQRLMGGSDAVEVGRIDRLRIAGASEGTPVSKVWGRMRLAGQVIWASPFEEHAARRRGGKGGGGSVTEYSYSISLAIGLCEGEILGIGRIWADGAVIRESDLTLRLYTGTDEQMPDPKIEAVEGAGLAPGYRGLAYVVIEDLDLAPWGNRVPMFNFEVIRAAQGPGVQRGLADLVRAVALVPGTGEYALATTPVHEEYEPGHAKALNSNSPSGKTDFRTSLDQLVTELPNAGSVSLVVSWFGDDLRAGSCTIRPKVEYKAFDGVGMPWRAGGIARGEAMEVPREEDAPIYGGTPSDASVVEAIRAIRAEGREVMFYPFILMEQLAGNSLPDPWSGGEGQPVMPWRGRITTALAPGRAGTTDRTAAATAEVAAFFGAAQPCHFTVNGEIVQYSGPEEWGMRRFILHYARLCAVAGGVDAFCIGSEMRGLTQIRGAGDSFPAVAALCQLAAEVKAILGPGCRVSYAADWTEYGAYVADGNVYFPLDPLWSDPAVDFVGIDNYMPLSDWRDGPDHLDAHWETIHSLDYLTGNVAGGEGFDWYYDSPEGEAAQNRLPITDGAYDEPWIYRVKDLRGWWENPHHPRTGGARAAAHTGWAPMSKPIVFTEYGCAAIDKGSNQPNRFLDLRSSESALPRASDGRRDDLMQMQYLRAVDRYWSDPGNNPVSPYYAGRMLDVARSHVWAWDARPFPEFPARGDLWADVLAYPRGHWLNGRATNQPLSAVIAEICADAGVAEIDTSGAEAVVRGYLVDRVQSARAGLQPLLLAYGCDVFDREGLLHFEIRRAGTDFEIDPDRLAVTEGLAGRMELSRAPEPEITGTVRLGHIDADGVYDSRTAEVRHPDEALVSVSTSEFPLALTPAEGRGVVHRWLTEMRVGRDGLRLALPLSALEVGPGARLRLPDGSHYRVERAELAEARLIEARRIERGAYDGTDFTDEPILLRPFVAPVPVHPVFLDLPLLTGEEVPHQPHVAVSAQPWPGSVAVWSETGAGSFELNRLVAAPALLGRTETALLAAPCGLWDRGEALRVRLAGAAAGLAAGGLASAGPLAVLNGANAVAIGDGSSDLWEVFQFARAELVAPGVWDLSMRLRGQLGTDGIMPEVWPEGSQVVVLDRALVQLDLAAGARGLARRWRIGVSARGHDDPAVVERTEAFRGIGLRPYPVAHLRARAGAGGLWRIDWIRRTRIEGDSWEQPEVPLGEESEAYILRVMAGEAILAEHTLAQPGFDYTAAMRAADGAGPGFAVAVAQVSQRFGPGPFRRILPGG
ncbi:baseplate multidomain protein megatron [Pseudogemmobacter sonorensis]|uniref:baseplate multidomain protein megatron n=1 Tax=Pseudogemmobacter sonorensis TaxID=2989681 RepID=UPI0036AA13E0